MIAGCDRRDGWVGSSSELETDCERALVGYGTCLDTALVPLERKGALHGVHAVVRSKKNLTPPTLSEMGMFRQSTRTVGKAPCCNLSLRLLRSSASRLLLY